MSYSRKRGAAASVLVGVSLVVVGMVAGPAEAATPVRSVIPHDPVNGIGSRPSDVAVDEMLHRAYVANTDDDSVSVIDTRTDTVSTVISPSGTGVKRLPVAIAVDPSRHLAYVANNHDGTVSVIDTTSNRVVKVIPHDPTMGIGENPRDIAIDSTTNRAYVCNYGSHDVSVIDTSTDKVVAVLKLAASSYPTGIAVDEVAHRAYITDNIESTVSVIDTTTDSVLAPIPHGGSTGVDTWPQKVAVDPVGHKAYVTQYAAGTVSVINTMTNTVVKTIPHATPGTMGIGTSPSEISIDPVSHAAFVANGDGTVSVVDIISDVVIDVVAHDEARGIGSAPAGIGIDSDVGRAYVANSQTGTVSVLGIQPTSAVSRIGGADRYAVAASVSAASFRPNDGSTETTVYVASGENFPDALSASPVAGANNAPVLLVSRDSIPAATAAELNRLKPTHVVVMGGENTISPAVEAKLGTYGSTKRIGGADRYAVSANLSAPNFSSGVPVVYIASGQTFPDALAGSAAAGHLQGPVLLVSRDGVPGPIAAELERLKPGKVIALGGPNTLSDNTLSQVAEHVAGAIVTRIPGVDRFEVSAAISKDTYPMGASTVYVASGAVFPDALSGSSAAVVEDAPVLLITKDHIPASVQAELDRLNPSQIIVLGGSNTVSDAVLPELASYIAGGV